MEINQKVRGKVHKYEYALTMSQVFSIFNCVQKIMEFPISKRGFQFQKMNESGEWWTRVGLEAALDGLVLQGSFSPNSDQRISTVGWNLPQYGSDLALYLRYNGR